ncbi:tRNA (34-2'-O)-methyltransferase regulator WDR6-like isoform X3 [Sycon ciliatum]|uniref:tRNA (34-2'-O)-methyltransferase regulator WDR6-like isoform X3 n=1 Tax=Sycon ciliatum TaxID=27933 RepID=UPI0031F5FFDE
MDFISKSLVSPSTALCSVSNWVISGNGSFVSVYSVSSATRLYGMEALPRCRIHGIRKGKMSDDGTWPILVFGQRSWRVFTATVCTDRQEFQLRAVTGSLHCTDWILDCCWLTGNSLAIATAHNAVEIWEEQRLEQQQDARQSTGALGSSELSGDASAASTYVHVRSAQCSTVCILYSCLLSGLTEKTLIVYAGTVFNQVLVWQPFQAESTSDGLVDVQHRLCGHEGVIFSIALSSDGCRACTASDDRTVRVWDLLLLSDDGTVVSSKCIHALYGHSARIWKAIFVQDLIVSTGEDALVCVWDHTGHLLKEIKGHQGLNVWSVCAADDGDATSLSIITGGGDGGIRWWSLDEIKETVSQQFSLSVPDLTEAALQSSCGKRQDDYIRDVAVYESQHVLLLMNSGRLLLYDSVSKHIQLLLHEPAFASYSVMSLDCKTGRLALGGLAGHVLCLSDWMTDAVSCSSCVLAHDGKVFSVTWATASATSSSDAGVGAGEGGSNLFTVGPEGSMKWWKVSNLPGSALDCQLLAEFCLPPCKHRWLSAVAIVHSQDVLSLTDNSPNHPVTSADSDAVYVIAGDRKGSLHTYRCSTACQDAAMPQDPVCSLVGVHGKNGVNDIQVCRGCVSSCGRDGHIRQLSIAHPGTLTVCSDRKFLPGVDWLERMIHTSDGRDLLIGFHSTNLIIWDSRHAETVATVPCGGGHRSWHYSLSSDGNSVTFVFLQACRLHYCTVDIGEWSRQRILQSSFHGREITCLTQVFSSKTSGSTLLASGSEDCSVRLSIYDPAGGGLRPIVHPACVHISGVRTMSASPLSNSHDNASWMLVSAGGRSQIKAWLISDACSNPAAAAALPTEHRTMGEATSAGVVSSSGEHGHMVHDIAIESVCQYPAPLSQRERRLRRQQPPTAMAAESRVMSVSTVNVDTVAQCLAVNLPTPESQHHASTAGVFAWAVYSDGWLRLLHCDPNRKAFTLIAESEQQDRSLLCVETIVVPSKSCVLAATAGGSGDVTVWDFTVVLSDYLKAVLAHSAADCVNGSSATTALDLDTCQQDNALPRPVVLATLASQRCTVTCLEVQMVDEDDSIVLLSGGDGGGVTLHSLSVHDDEQGAVMLETKWTASRTDCHGSTVTGLCWLPSGCVMSTSCDQHVAVWKIAAVGDTVSETAATRPQQSCTIDESRTPGSNTLTQQPSIQPISNMMSDVSDCHAMLYWKNRLHDGCRQASDYVLALAGAGMQCIDFKDIGR